MVSPILPCPVSPLLEVVLSLEAMKWSPFREEHQGGLPSGDGLCGLFERPGNEQIEVLLVKGCHGGKG